MKKKHFSVLLAALAMQAGFLTPVKADVYDNFPLENRAADALKPVVATTVPPTARKTCYLYNPPTYDRLWTVPCEPLTQVAEPMKMCRINNVTGWDAALMLEPCSNIEWRKKQALRAGK